MSKRTIPYLFEESVEKFGNNILTWEKIDKTYMGMTYKEMRERVIRFSAGLRLLGLKKNERAVLMAEGRSDWVMSELGILYAGGICVPLSIKIDGLSELKFRFSHSGSRFAIVSKSQVSRIREIKADYTPAIPGLEFVISLDPLEHYEKDEFYASDIIEKGGSFYENNREQIENTWKNVEESDYANICYTSGTSADPKGVILTHRNYTANVEQASKLFYVPEWFVSLLILPWDHCFAHTCGIYALMKNGASMASVQTGSTGLETLKNIPVNIKETRPAYLLSVPALAKTFRKSIEKAIHEKGPLIEKLFYRALKLAYDYNGDGYKKASRSSVLKALKKPLCMLSDKLIFSRIRENFGGRLKYFVGGGALLDIELQRFFYAIGLPMFQGYGLTETAPVISSNTPDCHKLGSSGKPAAGMEVKICPPECTGGTDAGLPAGEKGEIVVRGENIMAGYWNNEKAAREIMKDGWLSTGDMGYLDEDGFLYVLGRYKSLLIGNDGEKFSPEGIEEAIVENSPYIKEIMLYNNQNPYTVALLVPDRAALSLYMKENKLSCLEEEGQKSVLMLLKNEIDQYRDGGKYEGLFPVKWLPSAAAVLGEAFTEENRFLNSTLKMVRGKIIEFYGSRLENLYNPASKDICSPENKAVIGSLKLV
jgi:long-chain acyl-CoA synthetase